MDVVTSRDATWLNQVYGEWKQLTHPTPADIIALIPVAKEVGDDPMESSAQEDNQDAQAVAENVKESDRVILDLFAQVLRRSLSGYNFTVTERH